ncbi:hypothetical protein [Arthrobacter sp. MA-N2]|uniref:hypothetical protein n=1 Tax=Arthrobacter sp. MA-N2 TaxID=1101188 RepID=UPI0004B107C0|nr:hypothetical protein [Arthrobacter sp. MA-N2]
MRITVKETPEISGITRLHGTSNPVTSTRPGCCPARRRTAPDPCNGADFDVQVAETGEYVSPGPNLQNLQLDHFYLT